MSKERWVAIEDTINLIDDRIEIRNCSAEYVCNLLNEKEKRISKLEEQLKNAIVPKFKIGQEVWFVRYFNAGCYEFDYGKVIQIKITEYDGIFYEMEYLNKCEIDFRSRHEKYVFVTKEEAQAKLKQLKGEKDET